MYKKIIKPCIKRFQDSKAMSIFMILGLVMSMLIFSIGNSFVASLINAKEIKQNASPPDGTQIYINTKNADALSFDTMISILKYLSDDDGAIINNLMVESERVNTFTPVSAEWFTQDNGWHYPLSEGRYYTAREIEKGKNVILIGRELLTRTQIKNQKRMLTLEGKDYEVIGIVGIQNQQTLWDNRIFMPVTALPESLKKQVNETSDLSMIIYSNSEDSELIIEKLKKLGDNFLLPFSVQIIGKLKTEDILSNIGSAQPSIIYIAILGYFIAFIYATNIVLFWVNKRKYEIGLRKAFGYRNTQIIGLIIREMIGFSFLALCISFLLQLLLYYTIGEIMGYTLKIYSLNLILGVIMVIVTAILVSIIPLKRILKITPSEVLRECIM